MEYKFKRMASPVGLLTLAAKGDKLTAILWECEIDGRVPLGEMTEDPAFPILVKTEQQLNEYFAGERTRFELELDFTGTEFQKEVWAALLEIPFGETRSYGDIARRIGCPLAVCPVGAAKGRNPLSTVASRQCVLCASVQLTCFAGCSDHKALLTKLAWL